ncbi:MAG: zf-HC2 domain-containing protein [Treponema sp.]|jgi:anti-sigma factor RsiW|nr:zf-HC2 domain-containing protein [Treponema sp.]
MCPDHQMLSVYLDGELPSPWKEKMEKHLAFCASCRDRLESYGEISRHLKRAEAAPAEAEAVPAGTVFAGEAALEGAKDRVWLRLQNLEAPRRRPGPAIWRRSVSIPLPAAAAAAVIFCIALAAVLFRQNTGTPQMQDMATAGVDLDVRGIMPVSDMHGVLQYLGDQDTGDIVILRLPESRSFMSSGEPTLLKAADLPARVPMGSGRNTPR